MKVNTRQNKWTGTEWSVAFHSGQHTVRGLPFPDTLLALSKVTQTYCSMPAAFRPRGLNPAYIYRGGDLFKHMLPLTTLSMSNPALWGSTNATFSFTCITLKTAGHKVLELRVKANKLHCWPSWGPNNYFNYRWSRLWRVCVRVDWWTGTDRSLRTQTTISLDTILLPQCVMNGLILRLLCWQCTNMHRKVWLKY